MDSKTRTVLLEILEREGWPQYTNHPQDRGGPTKGGITLSTLRSWRNRPKLDEKELQLLKKEEAVSILYHRYVECNGIQKLKEGRLRNQVIDNAVLSGPYIAVKDLQNAVGVSDDGVIGPITLKAIHKKGSRRCNILLAVQRSLRLARFVQKNPNQLVFLVGWLNRCLEFVK